MQDIHHHMPTFSGRNYEYDEPALDVTYTVGDIEKTEGSKSKTGI